MRLAASKENPTRAGVRDEREARFVPRGVSLGVPSLVERRLRSGVASRDGRPRRWFVATSFAARSLLSCCARCRVPSRLPATRLTWSRKRNERRAACGAASRCRSTSSCWASGAACGPRYRGSTASSTARGSGCVSAIGRSCRRSAAGTAAAPPPPPRNEAKTAADGRSATAVPASCTCGRRARSASWSAAMDTASGARVAAGAACSVSSSSHAPRCAVAESSRSSPACVAPRGASSRSRGTPASAASAPTASPPPLRPGPPPPCPSAVATKAPLPTLRSVSARASHSRREAATRTKRRAGPSISAPHCTCHANTRSASMLDFSSHSYRATRCHAKASSLSASASCSATTSDHDSAPSASAPCSERSAAVGAPPRRVSTSRQPARALRRLERSAASAPRRVPSVGSRSAAAVAWAQKSSHAATVTGWQPWIAPSSGLFAGSSAAAGAASSVMYCCAAKRTVSASSFSSEVTHTSTDARSRTGRASSRTSPPVMITASMSALSRLRRALSAAVKRRGINGGSSTSTPPMPAPSSTSSSPGLGVGRGFGLMLRSSSGSQGPTSKLRCA